MSPTSSRRAHLEEDVAEGVARVVREALAYTPTDELVAARGTDLDLTSMARFLSRVAANLATAEPLAAAYARGAERRRAVLQAAGGALTPNGVAERLRCSRETVSRWRRDGQLLALPRGRRAFVFPACQFGERGPLEGLGQLLAAAYVRDPWGQLEVLLTPADSLEGQSPLEALRAGRLEEAIAVVRDTGNPLDEEAPRLGAPAARRVGRAARPRTASTR